jgi:hypothetical protein
VVTEDSGVRAGARGGDLRLARRTKRLIAAVVGALTAAPFLASAPSLVAAPAAAAQVPLVRVAAAPKLPPQTVALGAVASDQAVTGGVFLEPRNPALLSQFSAAVSDPRSPLFHHYLARGEFARLFGPAPTPIAAVEATLRAEGLAVRGVSSNGLLVTFAAPAWRVEGAFHTGLERYRLPDGTVGYGTTSAPELPATVARSVLTVVGLDDLVHARPALVRTPARRPAGVHSAVTLSPSQLPSIPGAPSACGSATAAATQFGGITDSEVAYAYGVDGLYSQGDFGQGQTVAIYELEPFEMSDIAAFDQCFFGADHTATQISVVPVDGGQPQGTGSGEAVLDIEDVSAIAPAAHIDVYEAPNTTFGGLDEYNQIVANDSARVVSTSWGLCETAFQIGAPGVQQAENIIFQQAAAQGQSVFAAAGDDGSDDCAGHLSTPVPPVVSVDDPASQPDVIGVGGTTMTAPTEPPQEIVWNDGPNWGAGGGGISNTWPMQAWQQYSGVPGVLNDFTSSTVINSASVDGGPCPTFDPATHSYCREVPDVSALADEFTGITIYMAAFGGWTTIGGTSSATPLWASILADINASQYCTMSPATKSGVGFAAPLLYEVAASTTEYADSFNNITQGNNDIFGLGTGFSATKGYSLAAGLGTPRVTNAGGTPGLAADLCQAAQASAPTVTGVSPDFGPATGGTAVEIAGTGFESSSGKPLVKAVQFGPATASFTVKSATEITAVAPAAYEAPGSQQLNGAGPADVTVTLDDGMTSAPNPHAVFDFVSMTPPLAIVPAVTGVGPYGGPSKGGNIVTVFGAGFEGDQATVTEVSFGGVAATSVKVVSPYELKVKVPPLSGTTQCATAASEPYPVTGLCQAQVVVAVKTLHAVSLSATATILPPLSGPITFLASGVVPPEPGTEVVPAATEYDYAATPTLTAVEPPLGDPFGGSVVEAVGSGYNFLTGLWYNFGPPNEASSEDFNVGYISAGGTMVLLAAPPEPSPAISATTGEIAPTAATVSVTAQTLGGLSAPVTWSWTGQPVITGMSTHAITTSGGVWVTLSGAAFSAVTQVILTPDFCFTVGGACVFSPPGAMVNTFAIQSDATMSFLAPAELPGPYEVQVCADGDASLCSVPGYVFSPPGQDPTLLDYYYPGTPVVTGVSVGGGPAVGPAHGGSVVTITGEDLTQATAVLFDGVPAPLFGSATSTLLPIGTPTSLEAVAPPGSAGATASVTVVTAAGTSTVDAASQFKYVESTPPPPLDVAATAKPGGAMVSWTPSGNDGGSPITGYQVTAATHFSFVSMPSVVVEASASATSVNLPVLQAGFLYDFTVRARNALGLGPATVVPPSVGFTPAVTATIPAGDNGYALAGSGGGVVGFGDLASLGSISATTAKPKEPVGSIALDPMGPGYWLAGANGAVYNYGEAEDFGSLVQSGLTPGAPIVGIAATPDGMGYWLVGRDGGVFTFGDAGFFGSLPGLVTSGAIPTNPEDIVAIVPTPDGMGYWLIGRDGGVFAFGDATWFGSLPALVAHHVLASNPDDIVGAAATSDGMGYWLVGRDGGVFAFGDAPYMGSVPKLVSTHVIGGNPDDVVGIAATPDGGGYFLAGADGGVFTFGDGVFEGSHGGGGVSITGVVGIGS